MNRMVLAGLSAAILATSSMAALAAPCGPAVLSKVDGKVLVNRGVGFMEGKSGMPLAVGDHVMLRSGSAEVLFVNGTGSALTGAKSMAITACSADGSRLTSPALGVANDWQVVPNSPFGSTGPVGVSSVPASVLSSTTAGISTTTMIVGGSIAAGAVAAVAIAAGNTGGNKSTVVSVSP